MMLYDSRNSRYFSIIEEVLRAAAQKPLSAKEIVAIISEQGFIETVPVLKPRLLKPDTAEGYGLLQETDQGFESILKGAPEYKPSVLELKWLKAMIQDPRIALFLDDKALWEVQNSLKAIKPLYHQDGVEMVDVSEEGDPYRSQTYIAKFRILMKAIRDKRVVKVNYESGKNRRLTGTFQPIYMEYSFKDDRFRLIALGLTSKRIRKYRLNLSRIQEVEIMDGVCGDRVENQRQNQGLRHVDLEIRNWRNGFERCFIQMSTYNRISEYNEDTKTCTMTLYYDGEDEAELLIHLLSFGPVVKVLGPESFKSQLVERIRRQRALLEKTEDLTHL